MATQKQVTEPAAPKADAEVSKVSEPVAVPDRVFSSSKKVKVYDTNTKEKLPHPVPETWLDGRFPHLKEVPSSSKKEGK